MKIYLASRYSRREELCEYRNDLSAIGAEVTSRWLNGSHLVGADGLDEEIHATLRAGFAQEDMADLLGADVCISFTEESRSNHSRGGRHVEFGAAVATGKRCIVIGHRENVFHCLPNVEFYATWPDALQVLSQEAKC